MAKEQPIAAKTPAGATIHLSPESGALEVYVPGNAWQRGVWSAGHDGLEVMQRFREQTPASSYAVTVQGSSRLPVDAGEVAKAAVQAIGHGLGIDPRDILNLTVQLGPTNTAGPAYGRLIVVPGAPVTWGGPR